MPPLLSIIQNEASSLVEVLTRCQKDLQHFQIPRLQNYKGTLVAQQQYAAELRDDLDLFSRNVKTLEVLGDDQEKESDRKAIALRVKQFTQSLEQLRRDYRAALLASKRAIDSLAQSHRDELFASNALSQKIDSEEKSENALMKASNDVTEALRRTIGLMQGELERSVVSSQMLEQSSAMLHSTTTAHDHLSTLLTTSKHLITALEKSDWLDRLLIFAAIAFFCLVVLFILKQRVLDKGLRLAFWWTRFVPDFHGDASLLQGDRTKAATTATAVTLSLAAMTSSQTLAQLASVIDQVSSTLVSSDIISSTASSKTINDDFEELFQSPEILQPGPSGNKKEGSADIQHQEL